MILVDSSGWIEFFTGGSQAARYAPYLTEPSQVITPTVVVYEVYKIIKRERTEEEALLAACSSHGDNSPGRGRSQPGARPGYGELDRLCDRQDAPSGTRYQ